MLTSRNVRILTGDRDSVAAGQYGVVLFCTFVGAETCLAEIDAGRKHAAYEPYVPQR